MSKHGPIRGIELPNPANMAPARELKALEELTISTMNDKLEQLKEESNRSNALINTLKMELLELYRAIYSLEH